MNSFLNIPFAYLEHLLQENLEGTCWKLHSVLGLPEPCGDMYSYHTLKASGRLSLLGPTKVGGFSGPVGITLCGIRQLKDSSWRGLCLKRAKVYVAISRASDRLHLPIVDLRDEVQIPSYEPLRGEGLALGLSSKQIIASKPGEIASRSVLSNQYNLVRLCNHSEFVWERWLGVPADKRYRIYSGRRMLPPTMFSEVMWEGIASESDTARFIAQSTCRADQLLAVLDHAFFEYVRMGADWGVPRMIEQKVHYDSSSCTKIFKDTGFWEKLVRGTEHTGIEDAMMPPEILDNFQRFRQVDEHESSIDGFAAVDAREHTSAINSFWKQYVIDALTIHLNKRDALVMVPVAGGLAPEYHKYSDPNWAIWSMWKAVYLLLRNGFLDRDPTELRMEITHHKRESITLTGRTFILAECNSQRPAFEIRCGEEILLHFYCAMGLEGQHRLQQALLARCSCREVAAAVVFAANSVLGLQYRLSGVSSFSPDSAEASEVRAAWDELITGLGFDHASERACLAEVDPMVLPAATATQLFASAGSFLNATLGSDIAHELGTIALHIEGN